MKNPLTPRRRLSIRAWETDAHVHELASRMGTIWPVPAECAAEAEAAQARLWEAHHALVAFQRKLGAEVEETPPPLAA